MCGRLDQHEKREVYAAFIGALVTERSETWKPRWNLPPSEPALIGAPWHGERRLGTALFGWRNPVSKGLLTSARSDKLVKSPLWSKHLAGGRCIVPASGWWEWAKRIGYLPIAHHLHVTDGPTLLAGLWMQDGNNARLAVVTSVADGPSFIVHSRVPVALRPEEAWTWAEAPSTEALALIATHRPGVTFHTVGAAVGKVSAEGPHLATPIPIGEQASLYARAPVREEE